MKLNGKELRVIRGAIIITIDIPLEQIEKRKLSKTEKRCLEDLYEKIASICDIEYNKCDRLTDSEETKIDKRLAINVDFNFTDIEFKLLHEAIEYYIQVASIGTKHNDLNVYYGGDQYRVDYEDFKKLLKRFEEE